MDVVSTWMELIRSPDASSVTSKKKTLFAFVPKLFHVLPDPVKRTMSIVKYNCMIRKILNAITYKMTDF